MPWDFNGKVNEEFEAIFKKIQKFIALIKYFIKEVSEEDARATLTDKKTE
jgi:hypothetical protein